MNMDARTRKISKTFIFFIIAAALCTGVRYAQLALAIDFETGFYYNNSGLLGSLLYIIYGAGFVGLLIFSIIDKKSKNFFFIKKMGRIDETESIIVAFMLLLLSVVLLFGLITSGFNSQISELSEDSGISIISTELLRILSNVVGIIGFGSAGLVIFIKKRITVSAGYMLLLPSVYYAARTFFTFVEHLVITRMSEHLVVLLIEISMVFFFLSAGRVFSRNESKHTRIRTSVTGYAAAALIFSETISKLFFWLTSSDAMRDYLSSGDTKFVMPGMTAVAEGIAVIAILFIMQKKPYNNDNENDIDVEIDIDNIETNNNTVITENEVITETNENESDI